MIGQKGFYNYNEPTAIMKILDKIDFLEIQSGSR